LIKALPTCQLTRKFCGLLFQSLFVKFGLQIWFANFLINNFCFLNPKTTKTKLANLLSKNSHCLLPQALNN
jgi:hypothetical protein